LGKTLAHEQQLRGALQRLLYARDANQERITVSACAGNAAQQKDEQSKARAAQHDLR
jgi:hypothetical protein